MSRETQRKGDLAKVKALSYFTTMGFDVATLLTESAPYDIIVDDGQLHRVQVKHTNRWYVDLRRIHSNSKGYVINKYKHDDFDWLFVYNPTEGIFLIKDGDFSKSYIGYNLNHII